MKLVGILGFGSVLIVAFGYLTIFGSPVKTEIVPVTTTQTESIDAEQPQLSVESEAFAGTGSIESLYERGEVLECQIIYTPNPLEAEITGTVYLSDGKVRADFVVPSADMTGQTVASIIYDFTTLYLWSEIAGETFGVQQTQTEFNGFADSAAAIAYDTEIQYDCLAWLAVDDTIFEPPTEVLFGEMSDISANMEFGTIYENQGEF